MSRIAISDAGTDPAGPRGTTALAGVCARAGAGVMSRSGSSSLQGVPTGAPAASMRQRALHASRCSYLAGVASWFVPQGMLSVLVPWIIGEQLQLDGARYFGFAYTLFTLPTVMLVLIGGFAADRFDARRVLAGVQGVLALAALGLAASAQLGHLSYPLLLAYLCAVGAASAFVRPARDSLLSRVAGVDGGVERLVTAATGVQFGVQILGFAAAAAVARIGTSVMFALMAMLLLAGAMGALRLPEAYAGDRPRSSRAGAATPRRRDALAAVVREPLAALRAAPGLAPVMLINLVVGVCYTGAYFVIVPTRVLALEGGGAAALAAANIAFMAGTLAATFALLRLGGLAGRHLSGMMLALAANAVALCAICLAGALPVVLGGMFVWGIGTGLAISLGRTIVQQRAPAELRARLLALYMLTFLSGTPFGSLLLGLLAEPLGARATGLAAAMLTATVLALVAWRTDVRRADAFVRSVPRGQGIS